MNATSEFPCTLIDVDEVARRLGCSTRTVFRMAATGEFPAGLRLRGLRRWKASDVDAAIEKLSRSAR